MRQGSLALALYCVMGLMTGAKANGEDVATIPSTSTPSSTADSALKLFPHNPWNNLEGKKLAETWVRHHSSRGKAGDKPADMRLISTRRSLLGTHYQWQQYQDGVPVDGATHSVYIAADGRTVYREYNNTIPASRFPPVPPRKSTLDERRAMEIAWQHLRVHGELGDDPGTKLIWTRAADGSPQRVWRINLMVYAPYGDWLVDVDAVTGKIHRVKDNRLLRKPAGKRPPFSAWTGPVRDFSEAVADWEKARAYSKPAALPGKAGTGSALVFDPEPRTTLGDRNLQDGSSASAFAGAYFERPLRDIRKSGNSWHLEGPWVRITDLDSPTNAPSTTRDGVWTAKRGNNAFNDAMTYFHVDQSQRYMQSLGFVDSTGIQYGPIEVDTDGANGADNSYFRPGANAMSFGHGCVDDNEDADVILHEYGHAIQHSINTSWNGGDTGAMGEGFGDYWAASYSYAAPGGADYYPEEVFSWDGHGSGTPCWRGRFLNAVELRYDPGRSYGAHGSLSGGRQTDELWSTPLFQAFLDLRDMGIPRDEIDRIVLEAHFGLGSGLTMRAMAEATVQAARMLHAGPHADVFIDKFSDMQILEIPKVRMEASFVFTGTGANGHPDPGETVGVQVHLKNSGTLDAGDVSGTLNSETRYVTVEEGSADWGDIAYGRTAEAEQPMQIAIGTGVDCGEEIDLSLNTRYNGSDSTRIYHTFRTGRPEGASSTAAPDLDIPDNDPDGISHSIDVDARGSVTEALRVHIHLTHTYIGDLVITLRSPGGKEIALHRRTGGGSDNIVGTWGESLTPAEDLSGLIGEELGGRWTLTISDNASIDLGNLVSWGIEDITGYQCD